MGISFSLIQLYRASFDQRGTGSCCDPRRSKKRQTTQTLLLYLSQMGFFFFHTRCLNKPWKWKDTNTIAICIIYGVGWGASFFLLLFTSGISMFKEYSHYLTFLVYTIGTYIKISKFVINVQFCSQKSTSLPDVLKVIVAWLSGMSDIKS